ncbi:MAG TPA: hypothetical protein VES42_20270 [Pilimelia sp.]|nr:hypothetical protein [Pilimelia sp.]
MMGEIRTGRAPGRRAAAVATALTLLAAVAGCGRDGGSGGTPAGEAAARQSAVASRGASVMPFDLERTTHRFVKTVAGGVQTVVADAPTAADQVVLVQRHLQGEADRFRRGDFTDPARIHGDAMPGLATLRESAGRLTVTYQATADGGRITYASTERAVVAALHAWFDAQVGDHGAHAEGD